MATFNTATWTGYNDNKTSNPARKFRGVITYTLSSPTVTTYKLEITKFEIEQTTSATIKWTAGTAGIEVTPTGKTKATRTKTLSSTNYLSWTGSGKKSISTSAMSFVFDKTDTEQNITVNVKAYKSGGTGYVGNVTSSFKFTIPALPISTIQAEYDKVEVDDLQFFYITSKDDTYTHKVTASVNNRSAVIYDDGSGTGSDDFSWHVPRDVAYALPITTSGTVKIACETYSGTTLIGTSYTSFKALIPASYKPTFLSPPITLTETATLPSAFSSITQGGKFIQGLSSVETEARVNPGEGATIDYTQIDINFGGLWRNYYAGVDILHFTGMYGNIEMELVSFDSRSRGSETTHVVNVVPYQPPKISFTNCAQSDNKITVNVAGSVSSVENNNTCTLLIRYRKKGTTDFTDVTVYNKSKTYDININREITVPDNDSYEIQIVLKDEVYDSNPIIKTLISNLSTNVFNSNKGYMLIDSRNKYRTKPYLVDNYLWSTQYDTGLSYNLSAVLYDDKLGYNFAYSSKNMLYYINSWTSLGTTDSNIIDMCTGLGRTFWLTSTKIYWINDDMSIGNKNIPAPCSYMVGNDTGLYIISQNGDIYYITSTSDNWKEPKYPTLEDDRFLTLRDFAPIYNVKIVSATESFVAIANTNSGWKIIYTPTTSFR